MVRFPRYLPFLLFSGLMFTTSPIRALTAERSTATMVATKGPLFGPVSSQSHSSSFRFHSKPRPLARLTARYRRRQEDDEDGAARERQVDVPTQTVLDSLGPPLVPGKPKIVVLGASGKIGRLVVQQLLEQCRGVDMTIVALVRDYDKAIKVLYEEGSMAVAKCKGPQLQIMQGDLVPPEELPGFNMEETEDEQVWNDSVESLAKFYGSKPHGYDNREFLPDVNEALEDAIKDCTTVISCVGAVRPTNLWTDVVARPLWRWLRNDVSGWCQDGNHPYYVHYASTRKALGYVEREQLRREAAAHALAEEEAWDHVPAVPRIRFIRISDLCVGQRPYHFVPLVTNMLHSLVFRYQEMAEQLLEQSSLVETVVLRPGDLVDEERDSSTTSLQVSHTGKLPCPARVGREDVASLAVASAMFQTQQESKAPTSSEDAPPPFHYTFACRWAGQELDPYPAQGRKTDGMADAPTALQRTLKTIRKNEKRSERRTAARTRANHETSSFTSDLLSRLAEKRMQPRKKPQPHGLCSAIPIYVMLGLLCKTVLLPLLSHLPGGKTWILPFLSRAQETAVSGFSLLLAKTMAALPLFARQKQYIRF